jgi:hypothetical protein
MNLFQRCLVGGTPVCDICGAEMIAIHGNAFDHDLIYCTDPECGAEVVFPTSTAVEEGEGEG